MFKRYKLICKALFVTNIILSWKLKYKETFAIACSIIVNKFCATDSSISPGLINKVHSIYISVPWLRFILMDLALRVLFHRFQIIFDWIRRSHVSPYLSRLELLKINKCNQIQLFPRLISQNQGDRSCWWTHEINIAPRGPERTFHNIILESTVKYNNSQPQNFTAKESRSTARAHGDKVQSSLHGLLTCSHVRHMS